MPSHTPAERAKEPSERSQRTPQGAAKEKDGKITTAGRLALPRSKFALPPSPEEKRRGIKGRFPIHDEAHARNALARVAQFGTEAEREKVSAAVRRSFPGIIQKAGGR